MANKFEGVLFFLKHHGFWRGGLLVFIFTIYNLYKYVFLSLAIFKNKIFNSKIFITITLFNKKKFVISKLDKGLSYDLYKKKIREPTATKKLIELFENENLNTFLDLGANLGYYDIVLGNYFKKLVCVEPNKKCIKILEKNLKLNNYSEKSIILNGAIHYSDKKLYMRESPQFNLSTVSEVSGDYLVETFRLDKILSKYKPDFIKMDIEGFEMDLFLNLNKELNKIKKTLPQFIFIEIHFVEQYVKKNLDLLKLLEELGYRIKFAIFEEKGPYYLSKNFGFWKIMNDLLKKSYIGSLNNILYTEISISNFLSRKEFLKGKYGAIEFIFEKV